MAGCARGCAQTRACISVVCNHNPTKSGINIVEWSVLNADLLDFRYVFALSNYGAKCLASPVPLNGWMRQGVCPGMLTRPQVHEAEATTSRPRPRPRPSQTRSRPRRGRNITQQSIHGSSYVSFQYRLRIRKLVSDCNSQSHSLHLRNISSSRTVSDILARFGRIMSPL